MKKICRLCSDDVRLRTAGTANATAVALCAVVGAKVVPRFPRRRKVLCRRCRERLCQFGLGDVRVCAVAVAKDLPCVLRRREGVCRRRNKGRR